MDALRGFNRKERGQHRMLSSFLIGWQVAGGERSMLPWAGTALRAVRSPEEIRTTSGSTAGSESPSLPETTPDTPHQD